MKKSPANKISLGLRLASFVCSCLVAGWLIGILDGIHSSMVEQLAVGTLTTSTGSEDKKVLCVDLDTSKPCLDEHENWPGRTVLWLGNSQLPTINQQKPGDSTMVELLHHSMIDQGAYVFGFAPPNANLQEHYALVEYLAPKIDPDLLILPVFFDDLREAGVRPQLAAMFDDSDVRNSLQQTEIGQLIVEQNTSEAGVKTAVASLPQSTMDTTEAGLNEWLEGRSPGWKARGDYRATFFFQLHYLRNTVFQIDPQSVRRMIPARYERNIAALNAILDSAQQRNIQVLMYIPPIRNDVPLPYDMKAYDQFKVDMEELAEQKNLLFADFENVVAPDEWGTKGSSSVGGGEELDFMHFAVAGHRKMANALQAKLSESLVIESTKKNKMISVSQEKVVQ